MAGTPEQRGRKFLGAEIDPRHKEYLELRAAAEDRSTSAVLRGILNDLVERDSHLLIGFVDPGR
jgi:hypothetical protein